MTVADCQQAISRPVTSPAGRDLQLATQKRLQKISTRWNYKYRVQQQGGAIDCKPSFAASLVGCQMPEFHVVFVFGLKRQ
jgi:hypothetical protein